jgi:hypothetical protein
MEATKIIQTLLKYTILAVAISLAGRIISWIRRIRMLRKSMPVIPTLFPPDSYYRRLWPKKWQTFHQDWNMQYKRVWYETLKSDNFALVCLFEYDRVYLTEPAAVYDLNIDKADQFLKDMQIFRKVNVLSFRINIEVCRLRAKCRYDSWRGMEITSQNYIANIFGEE